MIDLPEYTLDRPLSKQENLRRSKAHKKLNEFIDQESINEFEVIEVYAGSHGAFVLRTPSFNWSVVGKVAAVGYNYDK